ncbi:unnamed protein product [Chrysodeixis includens]|uniref:Nose resistant-to-fluoxetine protein N-terminal domain-containing protein n=1 Tax=Chrysodeixis includens TaxID=689277 RepID=A0A9N8L3Y1_CHRIL|nr:unnamed protein product [Chrysodeixis includens]
MMVTKNMLVLVLVNVITFNLVSGNVWLDVPNEAFDSALYEDVLDEELCEEQLTFISSDILLAAFFADAGFRIPKGVLEGNFVDLGNYHQCLGLNQQLPNSELQGKYCMIEVPLNQDFDIPFNNGEKNFDLKLLPLAQWEENMKKYNMSGIHRSSVNSSIGNFALRLAVCIPQSCTTKQALSSLSTTSGLEYTDEFCRLPNDKPWVPADIVAIVIFSTIGLLTILSTSYDVWQKIVLGKDPKSVSVLSTAFSVYTNGQRVMNFTSSSGNIECLDGIRALAMAWVVLIHTLTSENTFSNQMDIMEWVQTWKSLWITGAHITVDTFFTLSGFLVVYTTLGKFTGKQLMKNVHLYWLNRLLRMFPLLAAVSLWDASILNRLGDGPQWGSVANLVEGCRTNWWSTITHTQNYMNPSFACIGPTWYLAVDVQLHILSPILLFWVLLGSRKIAMTALFGGLAAILTAATTYNFIKDFQPFLMGIDPNYYYVNYYVNTLTRASPFFVGMIFGYFAKTFKIKLQKWQVLCFWILALSLSTFILYADHATRFNSNQTIANLYNSFIRPLWALFIGSLVYMCNHGYGGPINWFLCLSMWKIHSRLSFAIYLIHSGMMHAINHWSITTVYFTVSAMTYKFLSHYTFAFIVSFFAVLIIDAPFTTLFKLMLGGGAKKPQPQNKEMDVESPQKEVLE